jgi:Potential Queuosine, Q, salvage protein family
MTPSVDELMALFARAWRQLGAVLCDEYGGRRGDMVAKAGGSAIALTGMMSRAGYFADVYEYEGLKYPFLKRAQLACYDLSLFCPDDERCQFSDLDRLTIFADNLVPHVLKVDGVLTFDPDLEDRIEAGEIVPAGSIEEIEIRAMAVYASERLAALATERGDPVIPLRSSDWLWNRGQSFCYKARPRPRIRTVRY